jgi:hypothetical protein
MKRAILKNKLISVTILPQEAKNSMFYNLF